jgi:DNA-binding transcriptional LysR family regulator
MLTLAAMRSFARVVEAGSFSAAGRVMGAAPSSVSRQINELEESLGARLFHRTTRKLSLTEAGAMFFERVTRILTEVDEAALAIGQTDGAPSGILRLTTPTAMGRQLVSSCLPLFQRQYPAIQVVLSMEDYVVDLVERGYDLAMRVGRQSDSTLIARRIGLSRRRCCASPAYLQTHGAPERPEELADHNCLTFRAHPGYNVWRFRNKDGATDVRVTGSLFAANADVLSAAAVAGLGLVMLPDWNFISELETGALQEVLADYEAVPVESPIYAVYPYRRHVPPKVRVFIEFVSAHFAAMMAAMADKRA